MSAPEYNGRAMKRPVPAADKAESEKKPKRESAKDRHSRYLSRIDVDSYEALIEDLQLEIERLQTEVQTQINVTTGVRRDDDELRRLMFAERSKRLHDPLFLQWLEYRAEAQPDGTPMAE